nr:hypothetical protein Itr_chr03CG24810 [Ipomoea trifida]
MINFISLSSVLFQGLQALAEAICISTISLVRNLYSAVIFLIFNFYIKFSRALDNIMNMISKLHIYSKKQESNCTVLLFVLIEAYKPPYLPILSYIATFQHNITHDVMLKST